MLFLKIYPKNGLLLKLPVYRLGFELLSELNFTQHYKYLQFMRNLYESGKQNKILKYTKGEKFKSIEEKFGSLVFSLYLVFKTI